MSVIVIGGGWGWALEPPFIVFVVKYVKLLLNSEKEQ